MNRRALLVAVVMAAVAASCLVLYLQRFEREVSGGDRLPVLVVRKALDRGDLLLMDSLVVREIPIAYVESRAIRASEKSKVLGLPVNAALEPGQSLFWSDLAITSQKRDLSSLVQPGKRGVTVIARGAFDGRDHALIGPGDYVDVLATLEGIARGALEGQGSVVLLQRVLVLAVGGQTHAPSQGSVGGNTPAYRSKPLTLSLDLQEAQLLSLAIDRGTISVVLRNPDDTRVVENAPHVSAGLLSQGPAEFDASWRRFRRENRRPFKLGVASR